MQFIRGSSSYTRLEFHVCYKAKYCHGVFDIDKVRKECEEIFYEVSRKYEFVINEIGFRRDHVHLILLLKITQSIAHISRLLRGTAGCKILKKFPEVKAQYFWGSGLWSGMIYAESIGDHNRERLYNYVRNQ